MGLTSTLFTGLSGLDVNQTRLNVVGNNIANVNTVGFKSSRALFKPQFYVTDSGGSPPSGEFGGSNPSQRGMGATVSTVEKDWSTGPIESTGRPTDLAIDGEGFFVVGGRERLYTRDGSFTLNSRNELVNAGGMYVQGFMADERGDVQAGQLDNIVIPVGGLTKAQSTSAAFLTGNLDAGGDSATTPGIIETQMELFSGGGPVTAATPLTTVNDAGGAVLFAAGDGLSLNAVRGGRTQGTLEFEITGASTVGDFMAFLEQGSGIQPGVTHADGSVSGASLKAGGTTGTQIVLTSNAGTTNAVDIAGSALRRNGLPLLGFVEGSDAAGNAHNPAGESIQTASVVYDSLGNPLELGLTFSLVEKTEGGTTWQFLATSPDSSNYTTFDPAGPGQVVGGGTVQFDNDGRVITSTGATLTIPRAGTGAAPTLDVTLDFARLTSLAGGDSELFAQQDGSPMGTLVGFGIGNNGVITGTFDNGLTQTVGRLAMATFDNPQGLLDQGSSLYRGGANSGEPRIGGPLDGLAGGVRAGALELSNVDLSGEFINLIIASTGFSAASRVISTSDQLMTELINTSRR